MCPICLTYPHGDPNYVSQNLAAHLQLRHAYDMGEVIENEQDEDQMLAMALFASM